jgi:hypothetical protein
LIRLSNVLEIFKNAWGQAWWLTAIILAVREVKIGGITVQDQHCQNLTRPISRNKLSMVIHACGLSYVGVIGWRILI